MIEGQATWTEVTTMMSINDVMDMIDSADAHFEATNPPPERTPTPPRVPRTASR